MRLDDVAVAMVEPLYEINVGYVARCMRNFCLSKLILVNPRCPIGDEAIRFSMHGRDVLEAATIVRDLGEVIKAYDLAVGTTGVQTKKLSHVRRWITPESLARRISEYDGSILIVLGREDRGLTNDELSMCDVVVTIPANPEYPILNVSHAAVIVFYEIFKQAFRAEPQSRLPRREEVEVLLGYLRKLVLALGGSESKAERAVLMTRRLLGGSAPTDSDVRMLLGVLRGAYEAIKNGNCEGLAWM